MISRLSIPTKHWRSIHRRRLAHPAQRCSLLTRQQDTVSWRQWCSLWNDHTTGVVVNSTDVCTVYTFNVADSPSGSYVISKRVVYRATELVPDGLKVANNGYVVVATGKGLDVLDPWGSLILRAQTNFSVQNFAWT